MIRLSAFLLIKNHAKQGQLTNQSTELGNTKANYYITFNKRPGVY